MLKNKRIVICLAVTLSNDTSLAKKNLMDSDLVIIPYREVNIQFITLYGIIRQVFASEVEIKMEHYSRWVSR